MASRRRSSDLIPFEFLMTLKDKQRAQLMAREAGISFSELARRAIDSYNCEQELEALRIAVRANIDTIALEG
jgi:hypothetical protein